MPEAARHATFSPETLAELDRFGFDDPYDPQFIWTAVFGTRMRGHEQRWPRIDFEELASVNPDVLGWIHMDGTPVDYPIVAAHFDRSHYLAHNFSGEESCHGQVQLAFGCGKAIGGRNTVLSAHLMHDWSMFRAIRELSNQEYADAHPVVEILTPTARYESRWFAATRFHSTDPWPQQARFADDGEFEAWLGRIAEGNRLRAGMPEPDADSRILTCVTCAMEPGSPDMCALFAVLEER